MQKNQVRADYCLAKKDAKKYSCECRAELDKTKCCIKDGGSESEADIMESHRNNRQKNNRESRFIFHGAQGRTRTDTPCGGGF